MLGRQPRLGRFPHGYHQLAISQVQEPLTYLEFSAHELTDRRSDLSGALENNQSSGLSDAKIDRLS